MSRKPGILLGNFTYQKVAVLAAVEGGSLLGQLLGGVNIYRIPCDKGQAGGFIQGDIKRGGIIQLIYNGGKRRFPFSA